MGSQFTSFAEIRRLPFRRGWGVSKGSLRSKGFKRVQIPHKQFC